MKAIDTLRNRLSGLYYAISRYPLTVIFLIAAAIVNAMGINRDEPYYKLLLTFVVGAFLSSTQQAAFERFSKKFLLSVYNIPFVNCSCPSEPVFLRYSQRGIITDYIQKACCISANRATAFID